MTNRQAVWLALPGLVVLLAAIPFELTAGPAHLAAAGLAVGLSVPPAFGTFWFTRWLARRYLLGGVIGMAVGTVVRIVVAVGGGAVAFFLAPELRGMGLAFWLWVLFAYLLTLLVETALLARAGGPAVAVVVSGGKG